jgi:hypothetical protein
MAKVIHGPWTVAVPDLELHDPSTVVMNNAKESGDRSMHYNYTEADLRPNRVNQPYCVETHYAIVASYSSAFIRESASVGSDSLTFTNQPVPYGSSLIAVGASASVALT